MRIWETFHNHTDEGFLDLVLGAFLILRDVRIAEQAKRDG